VEGTDIGDSLFTSYTPGPIKGLFPLPDQTPSQVTDREYLIQQVTFSSGGISFSTIWGDLLNTTELSDFLKSWKYVKFGMQLRIQIVAPHNNMGLHKSSL